MRAVQPVMGGVDALTPLTATYISPPRSNAGRDTVACGENGVPAQRETGMVGGKDIRIRQ